MAIVKNRKRIFRALHLRKEILLGFCQCGCGVETGVYKLTDARIGAKKGESKKYLTGHSLRVQDPWIICPVTGCWLWQASVNGDGYGSINYDGYTAAHIMVYERFRGPVPDGLELDHQCRVRRCVNPDHLEPVTTRVNVLRGEGASAQHARATHCKKGHAYTARLNYSKMHGYHRRCWECDKENKRRYYESKRKRGSA